MGTGKRPRGRPRLRDKDRRVKRFTYMPPIVDRFVGLAMDRLELGSWSATLVKIAANYRFFYVEPVASYLRMVMQRRGLPGKDVFDAVRYIILDAIEREEQGNAEERNGNNRCRSDDDRGDGGDTKEGERQNRYPDSEDGEDTDAR